ncbi:MAG TPA: nucleotide pyrophosphohydrolase [Candidatus Limnocylindria bacterium]|nr:nucleotide pyrophosphohydrolase [Candidatus Limnocylindria bacterium]
MSDTTTKLQDLRELVAAFVRERDWNQFHTPKNLSMYLAVEAAELMEKFSWVESKDSLQELESNRQEVEDEVADVLCVLLCFANASNIDLATALRHKLALTAAKYPVEKAKGKATKYTKL